jgi:hypothetical protein
MMGIAALNPSYDLTPFPLRAEKESCVARCLVQLAFAPQ